MKNFHDLNNPLEIKYDNYYRNIDMKLKSYEVCRFNKVYLKDELPKSGSSRSRTSNMPENGKTTLLDIKNA